MFLTSGKNAGQLKADFVKAQNAYDRTQRDELFKLYMSGEKQKIMTAELFGANWKIKMDSYHPGKCIVDLKYIKDIHDRTWIKDLGNFVNFIETWGYDLQLAIYQLVVKKNTGQKLPCYIAAVDKKATPEIEIIQINQMQLDASLIGIEPNVKRILELKKGNGLIKEYNKYGKLIFEGEYLNGKRNGKGKEYYDYDEMLLVKPDYLTRRVKEYNKSGDLIFEGEYLNNYKLKGREYINRRLSYEGDYLYNLKWNGKGYNEYGDIIYELDNGNGVIKEFNSEGVFIFEGEYFNGKRNGEGKEYYADKLVFEGEYFNGQRNGKGKEYNEKGAIEFEGEYLNGERNGTGKEYDIYDQLIYDGEFLNGKRHGKGKEYYANKLVYEGEFLNGERNDKKI